MLETRCTTFEGKGDVEVKRVIDPLESFHLQYKEEVQAERAAADPGGDRTVAAVFRRAGVMKASSRGTDVSAETHIHIDSRYTL